MLCARCTHDLSYTHNRLPVLQISMFRSSSQDLVSASGKRRPAKPSWALCIIQSTTTCCTDCVMCPQAHVADAWVPQSFNVLPTRAAMPQRRSGRVSAERVAWIDGRYLVVSHQKDTIAVFSEWRDYIFTSDFLPSYWITKRKSQEVWNTISTYSVHVIDRYTVTC